MNSKELGELRRRLTPEKTTINMIHGCYVSQKREIISAFDASLRTMPEDEAEKYLNLLKKALSGALGRNLIDIVFRNEQVMDSDEHRLLMSLRTPDALNEDLLHAFYQQVIESLEMEGSYLILLAQDTYEIPYRGKDDTFHPDAADDIYSYVLCSICPVKTAQPELSYYSGESSFHSSMPGQIVSMPELGFLFPAFDNRTANLYNALYYAKNTAGLHYEFVDAVFRSEAPMSADEQKEAFQCALGAALDGCDSFSVVQGVQEKLTEMIAEQKAAKTVEPLEIGSGEMAEILKSNGATDEQAAAFKKQCAERFGEGAAIRPANITDSKRFVVHTGSVTISADAAMSSLIEGRRIDGKQYILVRVDDQIDINDLPVAIK